MSVLITAASKYRATLEIGTTISETLAAHDIQVATSPIEDVAAVDDFDAVVIGSAVYAGRWLKAAREFVDGNAAALAARPVWLFSSGPIGNPPKPEEERAGDSGRQ